MISVNQFSSSKILQHIDRISEWKREGVSRPVTYELDMTNVCNCRCHFCFGFFEQNEHQVSMSLKDARNILDQIKSFGGKAVTFTGGGDPLCNKDTIEAVKYAKKIGLDVGFITNGILLSYEISKEIVKTCTWIRISLDAASEETYKLTHGMNSSTFKIILENVRLLVKAKKEEKSETTIGVGFLTYDRTVDEIVDFAKISKELGVDYAQYRPLLKRFNEKEFNVKDQNKVISSIEKAKKYSDEKFDVVSSVHKYEMISTGTYKRQYDVCYGHNFATVIAADRKMYLCCHMRGMDKYCLGDLTKQTLKEIWMSDRRKKIYNNIDFKDCPLLCRCDSFNTILSDMEKPVKHVNFL